MSLQPKALPILLAAEFAERFSFWGLQSLLVLYLTKALSLPTVKAYVVFGTCTAFTYALGILGGILADKLLGFRRGLLIGNILAIIGNLFLIIPTTNTLFLGLALIICGTSLFVPNNANLLGTFYEQHDPQRAKGFSLLYMGTNLGGLLGPVAYGIIATKYGWHYSFIVSAFILGLWLCLFLTTKQLFADKGLPPKYSPLTKYALTYRRFDFLIYLILIVVIFIIWLLIQYTNFAGGILGIVGIATLIGLFITAFKQSKQERNIIFTLLIMMAACLLFFASELQVNSSLILFVDHYVDRQLLGWQIPSNTFAALEPLFVIILAPLLGYCWPLLGKREPSAAMKLILGLLLESISFYIFYLAGHSANGQQVSIGWIFAGNLLLGAGEVCLMPTVVAAVTKFAPYHLKGTLMGTLYLAIAFSSYFSGLIAVTTSQQSLNSSLVMNGYTHVYITIAQFTLAITCISLLAYCFKKFYQRQHKI
jgi:proton-dependent oligopeptide transporter, POT family